MNTIPIIEVSYQPIELCKLLKIANLVGGGGEAKIVITEGYVLVNNEVEYQKRKKIYHQDIVEFNGELIEVYCSTPVAEIPHKKSSPKKTIKDKTKHAAPKQTINKSGRRKRISF